MLHDRPEHQRRRWFTLFRRRALGDLPVYREWAAAVKLQRHHAARRSLNETVGVVLMIAVQ